MSPSLAFTASPKKRNNLFNFILVKAIIVLIMFPQFCAGRLKPELITENKSVYIANIEKCKLLTDIDSIIKFARDSLPNCNFENLRWIDIVEISEPGDTSYYFYNGKQHLFTKDFKAKPQDVINVFLGEKPSSDLKIVFSHVFRFINKDKCLKYNGKLYRVEDYIYDILKTEYKFSKTLIKEKYWDHLPLYEIPVFSVVITKEGKLREFYYGSIHTWVKHIFD